MRIDIKGDKEIGVWYLPVVKAKATDFVARVERAKLKQCRTAIKFDDPPAIAFIQYHFGSVNVQIITPEPTHSIVPGKIVYEKHDMVLVCGDEEIGYVVSVMSLNTSEIRLLRFATMRDVMKRFPVAQHEELHKFRYSFSAENGAMVTEAEPILDGFLTTEPETYGEGIHLLAEYDRTDIPATRCAPPGFEFNSKLDPDDDEYSFAGIPYGGMGISCLTQTPVSSTVLGSIFGGIQLTSTMEYVPRIWIVAEAPLHQFDHPGRFAHQKMDVSLFVNGASSLTGINSQAWVLPGGTSLESAISTSAMFIYSAVYANMDTTMNPFYDQATYINLREQTGPMFLIGAKSVYRTQSPAGPLVILNDDELLSEVWDRICWQFNDDLGWTVPVPTDYPGGVYPWNVPFMASSLDPIYVDLKTKCDDYKQGTLDEQLAREYYSCDPTSFFFEQIDAIAPMTQTVEEFLYFPVTGLFIEENAGLSHRPCMTCAKNIPISINLNGTEYNIYVSVFLEAKYVYNENDLRYYPENPRVVGMGACTTGHTGSCNPDVTIPKKIMSALVKTRNYDLLNARIQALDPYPCAGSTMFYFYDTSDTNYFENELVCFEAINSYRATKSVPKLKWDITLTTAARLHLNDLCTGAPLGHTGSDGKDSNSRIMACGCAGWSSKVSYISEIIAIGPEDGIAAVEAWKLSTAGHHEALYTKRHIAVGLAVGIGPGDQKIWVVTFAGDFTLDDI